MPQYLIIAENVYKKIEDKNLFSESSAEQLNQLVGVIRNEIKGTKFKLKYNLIDFEECLTRPLEECAIKLDMSLMPNYKIKMNIYSGLQVLLKELQQEVRQSFHQSQNLFLQTLSLIMRNHSKVSSSTQDDGEMIINYFKSDAFNKIISQEK